MLVVLLLFHEGALCQFTFFSSPPMPTLFDFSSLLRVQNAVMPLTPPSRSTNV